MPFGLVRYGVAPDHPNIKNITKRFSVTANSPNFNFLGNVTVGTDITYRELRDHYDIVIFANGAIREKRLQIEGEDLPGCHGAIEFLAWLNGHPSFQEYKFDLSSENAVIIGNGNVALDVVRLLARDANELKSTDITMPAYETLSKSDIRTIYLIGRRGPVQAAFSYKEIREIAELNDCTIEIDKKYLDLNAASQHELQSSSNNEKRNIYELLKTFVNVESNTKQTTKRKLILLFNHSPRLISNIDGKMELTLEENLLTGPAGHQKAQGSGQTTALNCGVIFRSIGHIGEPIDGIPFDSRSGTYENEDGRVMSSGEWLKGTYAAGWIKRGSVGLIGNNRKDSLQVVQDIVADLQSIPRCKVPSSDEVRKILSLRGVRVIDFEDWQKIDTIEINRGKELGKSREKIRTLSKLLESLES